MIKHKDKYETSNFTFWLTQYEKPNMYDYDIIFASTNVAPSASKNDLKGLSNFINNFLENNDDNSTTS